MPEFNTNRNKALAGGLCGTKGVDRRGNEITEYPAVDCDGLCKYCCWNPKEAERRMKTGKFMYNEQGLRSLHFSMP